MSHYICTGGCGGESSIPGVCQTEGCKKEGEPLLACGCEDGLHESVIAEGRETDEEETD